MLDEDNTKVEMTETITHAIAGDKIVDSELSVCKDPNSKPMYIRAKLSFRLKNENETDVTINSYLEILKKHTEFNIVTTPQHGAVWTEKDGDYCYLVREGTTRDMFIVENAESYVLTNLVKLPLLELKQIEGDVEVEEGVFETQILQYGKKIVFTIAFESIQSDNVEHNFIAIKNYFNSVYGG